MKLTKLGHACLVTEKDNSRLMIDPGSFTELPDDLGSVNCVVVTEEHMDHFNIDNLKKIMSQNPEVTIYSTDAVSSAAQEQGLEVTAISNLQTVMQDGYELRFYETAHAPVYKVSPCRSLSLKVDNFLYYPSDSYHVIEDSVEFLAVPTSGPWFKIEEVIDFANQVKSRKLIATHNALNSEVGNEITNNYISKNLSDQTREFLYLKPGESTE